MRVIAGSAKGTRLARVPAGTRPLSDRAREGLFSSLAGEVAGSRFADLYAGTGAVGIEALSRGAVSCLFVDSGGAAVRTIRANLAKTGLRGQVVRSDVLRALGGSVGPFDLAVLDPPYAFPRAALQAVLDRLAGQARGGVIALTRPKAGSTDVIPIHWQAVKALTYGDARILICRETS